MSQANDLTGLALRRRVAELRGFEDVYEMENGCLAGLLPDSEFSREVPAYESDIAAAWELVEEMNQSPPDLKRRFHETVGDMLPMKMMTRELATFICRAYIAAKEAQHAKA